MDFIAVSYRNQPYIDGQTYPRMCFACAHVPREVVQKYDDEGNVVEEIGPLFSYKHLYTPEELVLAGTCETLAQARRCVRAVKMRLKEVGKKNLDKLKLRRPTHEYQINDEHEQRISRKRPAVEKVEEPVRAPVKRRTRKVAKKPTLSARKVRKAS